MIKKSVAGSERIMFRFFRLYLRWCIVLEGSANGELLSAITFLPVIVKEQIGGREVSTIQITITDVETFKDDIYGLRNRSNRQTIVTASPSIFTAFRLYTPVSWNRFCYSFPLVEADQILYRRPTKIKKEKKKEYRKNFQIFDDT